jgi:DNA-binding beta-propeller fold protein YncE
MQKFNGLIVAAICLTFGPIAAIPAAEKPTSGEILTLVHRYQLPTSIKGHFDHFAVDPQTKRLFGTAVEDKKLVIFDLSKDVMTHVIQGIEELRAVLYRPDISRLFVSNGAGALRIFDSKSYQLVKTLKLLVDADPNVYDPATQRLFSVNGGEKAKRPYSNITVFDTNPAIQIGDIQLDGIEIEGMAVEKGGPRLFANNRDKNQIDVFDREKLTRIATWPVTTCKKKTVMALDESTHRMFVACHEGQLVVIDLATVKELQTLPIGQGADDIDFDKETKRIYVAGGGGKGSVDVYNEVDADHYQSLGRFLELLWNCDVTSPLR